MTEAEIIACVTGLPGVEVVTASQENGAPEVAWGDSFFFYDPAGDTPADRRLPFATIVTQDYHGFDEFSNLDRPGVFRLNVAVGRARFQDLLGYPPAAHADQADIDYAAFDRVLPHPTYAVQGWVSIVNPGEETGDLARALLMGAHARAAGRHHPHPRA